MKRSRFGGAVLIVGAIASTPVIASADPPPPVDVRVSDPPPAMRYLTIEWNPLSAFLKRASFSVEVTPVEHHALTINAYYFNTSTNPFTQTLTDAKGNAASVFVGEQNFTGFGGEIGYRYYLGLGGPRGFFIGPSLLLAYVSATAADKSKTTYGDLGGAVDAGYQALILDRLVIGVGAGIQYTHTTTPIPPQQLPAKVYAQNLPFPRALLALGAAF